MSGRAPEAVLDELGRSLEQAWRRPRLRLLLRPGRLPRARRLAAVALAVLVVVPSALAARDAIWAPDPAPLPDAVRPPGAVTPERTGAQVYVAAGTVRGTPWRVSASACEYGTVRVVGVFLTVPGGGAGTRCDVATDGGGGLTPRALERRLVQTYFEPASGRVWVFGVVPARIATVDLATATTSARVRTVAADPDAVGQGDLPEGMRVFVAALDGVSDVPTATARDAAGRVLLVCHEGRCSQPAANEETP